MRQDLIAHFLHETQIVGHISGRDVVKRIATAALMATVCFLAGFTTQAYIAVGFVAAVEIAAYPLNSRAGRFDQPISLLAGISVFLVNWISVFAFLSFAIILSHSDTTPFILAGFLWIFGICVHISNSFGLMPVYNWTQMTPTFVAIFVMVWNMSKNPAHNAPTQDWIMVSALVFVYVVNTFVIMNRQKDTHLALEAAREEAYARLVELERLARHDPLTGLMNRRAFDDVATSQMRQHANKLGITVYLIDLDGFKPVNDSYSHHAGDTVLCTIAERLQALVDKNGCVARLGGDEFAVLKSNITSPRAALAFGAEIITAISRPIQFEQKHLQVGASVGIARQSNDTPVLATLMSGADQAMFRAKQDPNRVPMIYDKSAFPVRATLQDRKVLLSAFDSGEIRPYYQPKVSLDTNHVVGFEALSRWEHPKRGLLMPASFLPQINELGLQGAFTLHTAECVLADIAQWIASGLDPGEVSINVSEVTLATVTGHADLMAVIDRYPQLRHHLTFEITEDIFIARSSEIIQRSIANFRRAGVRISLDDFGTGFASFQHLKDLEFDELKLDSGFVRDLGHDTATNVLVDGLLTMGKGLGVQVVAEGVETTQQRDILRRMGCHVVQGYYYGKAEPFSDAFSRLQENRRVMSRPLSETYG